MSPSISEEAGQTARGIIDALKQQPLVLAMVLMNTLLVVMFFYYVSRQLDTRDNNLKSLFEGQEKIFAQWKDVFAQNRELAEKAMSCVNVEDAVKLIQGTKERPVAQP
jgi:hypothetical protein